MDPCQSAHTATANLLMNLVLAAVLALLAGTNILLESHAARNKAVYQHTLVWLGWVATMTDWRLIQ